MSGTLLGVGWWVCPDTRHGQEHDGLIERQLIVSVRDQNTKRALVHRGVGYLTLTVNPRGRWSSMLLMS